MDTYKKTDNTLYSIAQKLSTIPCAPLNLEEEREKFFRSETYNPTFKYPKPSPELEKYKGELRQLKIEPSPISRIFNEKRNELIKIIEMMQAIGTTRFTERSINLYDSPDDALVRYAWKLIKLHDVPEKTYIATSEAVVHLTYAMQKYKCSWNVREKNMVARACVDMTRKTLWIKKDTFFTKKFIARLIVHEIGTHIVRHENGSQQPYKIFAQGMSGYLETEEGLAVLNEELNNCLTKATIKTYAARVIAVHKAIQCTFRETYNYLLPYVGKDNAFEITMRAKRGISNTFFPGAFTKDHLYLKGYFEVKKYLTNGGDLQKLYYGKIGIKDISDAEKILGLINPLFLTKMKHYTNQIRYR
ncbi:MAG: tyrosine/phenylalanine carboxypeptidase domain-containing protein [Candidatus Woesearchaeota archaeon]